MNSAVFISLFVIALVLPGCASDGITLRSPEARVPVKAVSAPWPDVPGELRDCFAGTTQLPAGAWSREVTGELLSKVRRSELEKTSCGRRLIEWYDDTRKRREAGA